MNGDACCQQATGIKKIKKMKYAFGIVQKTETRCCSVGLRAVVVDVENLLWRRVVLLHHIPTLSLSHLYWGTWTQCSSGGMVEWVCVCVCVCVGGNVS